MGEVEAYSATGKHLGAIDPMTKFIYKAAECGRKIDL